MIAPLLAVYCLLATFAFVAAVFVSARVGRLLANVDFSWLSHGVYAVLFLGLAILLSRTGSAPAFAAAGVGLCLLVLARAAADAQVTGLREKLGFVQLYAGLCFVEAALLARSHALSGTRAAPWLAFEIGDVLGHMVLPLASLGPAGGAAADVVSWVQGSLSGHFVHAAALATFAAAAYAYAHFAEQATPNVGLALAPAPDAVAVAFAAVAVLAAALGASLPGVVAHFAHAALAPFFVAEGLWAVHRAASHLRLRLAIVVVLAGTAVVAPWVHAALAWGGWAFHLANLRALRPILGDVQRSAARPRLGAAFLGAIAAAAACLALAVPELLLLRRVSPGLEREPTSCADVSLTEVEGGVVVEGGARRFTIDADETPLAGASFRTAEAACAARGARPCTSDEWALACVCSYPNESEGGPKLLASSRLPYRAEQERAEGPGAADVRRLLTGAAEIVAPPLAGGVLVVAGPADAVDDSSRLDCRTRSLQTSAVLARERWRFVATRCCR
jgi:hypothetical protein